MFSHCYEEGKNRQGVTAEVFLHVADVRGMFSRSLRLSTLPVLEQHSPTPFNKVTPLGLSCKYINPVNTTSANAPYGYH